METEQREVLVVDGVVEVVQRLDAAGLGVEDLGICAELLAVPVGDDVDVLLGLDDRQSAELARILDVLKTERAQSAVDYRRAVSAFADALAGGVFDQAKAAEGGTLRVQSAERLRVAVQKALEQIHAVLNPEQRERLAYLIRTGAKRP